MEVVIIRLLLVHWSKGSANFESMMRWLARGVLLPLAAVSETRRSLVALDNQADLMDVCLNSPIHLFYLSPVLLKLEAAVLTQLVIGQCLYDSFQLDIAKIRQLSGWTLPLSVDDVLQGAAAGFRP